MNAKYQLLIIKIGLPIIVIGNILGVISFIMLMCK